MCEFLKGCLFYSDKMPIDHGIGAVYKKQYCEGDHTACARYRVFTLLGKEQVPLTLYPNMHGTADGIMKKHLI